MAVVNTYMPEGLKVTEYRGGAVVAIACTFEVAAADDDGSVYRFAKLSKNLVPIPTMLKLTSDAIAGLTSASVGLYKTLENGGTVAASACFKALTDMNAGYARGSEVDCTLAIAIADVGKQIWELAGETYEEDADDEYDLALTAAAAPSAAGTLSFFGLFVRTA